MKLSTKLFAIVSAMLFMFSASAYAGNVNIEASPVVPQTYAQELISSPTDVIGAAVDIVVQNTLGFSIAAGTSKYVRYDLANATFGAQVVAGELVNTTGAFATTAVSVGGSTTDAYVIFEVEGNAAGSNSADGLTFTDADGFTVSDNSTAVTIRYRLFETAADAVNETNALADTAAQTIINYATGVAFDTDAITVDGGSATAVGVIDVTQTSLQFAASTTPSGANTLFATRIGDVDILVDTTVFDPADDAVLAAGDITQFAAAGATLTLTGDFTAAQNADGTYTGAALSRVFIDNNDFCDNTDTVAATLDATTATLTIGQAEIAEAATLCLIAAGNDDIGAVTFTADYASASVLSSPATMTLETLTKNGASDSLNLALRADSSYTNLVRITNSGTVSGDVFITLINDAGDTATFDLADVEGVDSSTLASGASTIYLSTSALYDAAQVADSTFDVGTGLLRLNIDSTCTEIIAQAIALSKDTNVFTVIDSVDNASN